MDEEADESEEGLKVSVDGREGTLTWDGRPRHQFVEVQWDDDRSVSGIIAASRVKWIAKQEGKEKDAKEKDKSEDDLAERALLQNQQRIIEEQRGIIEEQRRIINQRKVEGSDMSSTVGSARSLPATSISSGSAVVHLPTYFPQTLEPEPLSVGDPVPIPGHVTVFDMTHADAEMDITRELADAGIDITKELAKSPDDLIAALMIEINKEGGLARYKGLCELGMLSHDSFKDEVQCLGEGASPSSAGNPSASVSSHWAQLPLKQAHDAMKCPPMIPRPKSAEMGSSSSSLALAVPTVDDSCGYGKHSDGARSARSSQVRAGAETTSRCQPELWKLELGSWVLSANVSPRGRWLCTGSEDKTARIYDLVGKAMLQCFPHDGWVWSSRFSPDGLFLCTGAGDSHARVFDLESEREVHKLLHGGVVRDASLNGAGPGQLLLTACQDKFARLFNAASGDLVSSFEHAGWVLAANWSPEWSRFCTASDDHCARVFDAETGQLHQVFEHDDWVRSANYGPDGNQLCTASDDKSVRIYDLNSKVETHCFEHSAKVSSAGISPDGNWLCTACDDNYAYIFDLKKGIELLKFKHEGRVCSSHFSPDGRRLCSASEDGCVRVFGYSLQSTLSLISTTRSTNLQSLAAPASAVKAS